MKILRIGWLVLVPFMANLLSAQTACIDGFADGYPCDNVDLLARLTTDELLAEQQDGIFVNDVWGWTDPVSGKEYVIVGMANGTSFVDISDPVNPIMLGILPEHHVAESAREEHDGAKSSWRDIKVYQDHAFIVSEDVGHGMQVFDLTDLRDVSEPPLEFMEAGHYDGLSQAHNIVIDEDKGYAYAVGATGGSTCSGGGLHIINIQDPTNPVYEACFDDDGYTHDAQCVIYAGSDDDYKGMEICFNSNEDTMTIVNVNNKEDIYMISRTGYDGAEYTHQGWLTEDHNYFLSNDELDEFYGITTNTKTFIWDVRDLDAPVLIGEYVHPTTSIDHNLYTVGNRVYESNYTSGLRILDISDIASGIMEPLGYFDTYPSHDNPVFLGTWSNYPFFESGVVAVGDITGGLFLLKPRYDAFVTEHPESINACVGEYFDMSVEVTGVDLAYVWQINKGTGFEDIVDLEAYVNTDENTLHVNSVGLSQNQYQFRCKITTSEDEVYYTNTAELIVWDEAIADFEFEIAGKTATFTNKSYSAETYAWDFGDGSTISSESSPQYAYNYETFDYQVTLTASNDCGSHSVIKVINIILGIDQTGIGNEGLVYPVPATDEIVFDARLLSDYGAYTIYSLSGKSLITGRIPKNNNVIDIRKLQKGMYLIEFQGYNSRIVTQRILVE